MGQKRFFKDLDQKLLHKTDVVYPSVNKKKKFKKKKNIVFVGKLNVSKGYDIYGKAINKILDEFPRLESFLDR